MSLLVFISIYWFIYLNRNMLFYIMINMYMLNCINNYLFVYIYRLSTDTSTISSLIIYIYNIHKYQRMCVLKNSLDQFQRLVFKRIWVKAHKIVSLVLLHRAILWWQNLCRGADRPIWLGNQLWDEAVSCFFVVKVCVKVGKGVNDLQWGQFPVETPYTTFS